MKYWYLYVAFVLASCTQETLSPQLKEELPEGEAQLLKLLKSNPEEQRKIAIYWKLHKAVRDNDRSLAIQYLNNQIEIATKLGSNEALGKAYHGIGYIHYKNKNQIGAIRHYLKAYDNFELAEKPGFQALELNNISAVLMEIEDYAYSIEFLQKAEKTYQNLGDIPNQVMVLMNLGICNMKKDAPDFDAALNYFDRGIELNKQAHQKQKQFFNRLHNLKGLLKFRTQDYKTAIGLYRKSNEYSKDFPDVLEKRMVSYNNIGESYAALGDHKNAFKSLSRAKDLAAKGEEISEKVLLDWYAILSSLYQKSGNHAKAISLLEEGIGRAGKGSYSTQLLELVDLLTLSYNNFPGGQDNEATKSELLNLLNLKTDLEGLRKTANKETHQESMRTTARKEIEINGLKKKLAKSRVGEEKSDFMALFFGLAAGVALTLSFLYYRPQYKRQLQQAASHKLEAQKNGEKASRYRDTLRLFKEELDKCDV